MPPHPPPFHRGISIHAPREGCDTVEDVFAKSIGISIHAPREGCDGNGSAERVMEQVFQSTHPVRGATRGSNENQNGMLHFNPRTP